MDIKSLPKVELHCHLDGSVPIEVLYKLLLKDNYIEEQDIEEFKKMVSVNEDNQSLKEYLEKFKLPLKVMQNEKNLELVTYETLKSLAEDNVIYAEIRFAPYLHMEEGLTFDQVVEAIIRGKNKAEKEFDIKSNLILIAMRHEDKRLSMELVEKGSKFLEKGVVAVDLAGNEADFPPEIHKEAFEKAKELGYRITIHAGETGIKENIDKAIDELHAERIGHGIAAIKSDQTMNKLVENKIALEMCPISNLDTKAVENIQDYPIKKFIDKGIIVTVNTDNITVSNTNLNKEYQLLIEKLDFSIEDLKSLIRNSINYSFAENNIKNELIKKIDRI